MWHIYTMKYYSAIKRNATELFVVRWMDLESVIQSEVSQKREKQIPYANTYIWNLKKKLVMKNWFAGQKQRHRCRKQTYGHQGGGVAGWWWWWWDELGDWD